MDKLPPVGKARGHAPKRIQPRILKCTVCGQDFDLNKLEQVLHHHSKPHEPLESAVG